MTCYRIRPFHSYVADNNSRQAVFSCSSSCTVDKTSLAQLMKSLTPTLRHSTVLLLAIDQLTDPNHEFKGLLCTAPRHVLVPHILSAVCKPINCVLRNGNCSKSLTAANLVTYSRTLQQAGRMIMQQRFRLPRRIRRGARRHRKVSSPAPCIHVTLSPGGAAGCVVRVLLKLPGHRWHGIREFSWP